MKHYVKFTEINDWEAETWHFFIPYEGNEKAIERLALLIRNDKNYKIHKQKDSIMWTEKEVDTAIKEMGDNTTYMSAYNKLKGKLNIKVLIEDYKRDPDNTLYKGRIKEYMEE